MYKFVHAVVTKCKCVSLKQLQMCYSNVAACGNEVADSATSIAATAVVVAAAVLMLLLLLQFLLLLKGDVFPWQYLAGCYVSRQ